MYEKIMALYPELTSADFVPSTGTILIQNNSDGNGEFIAKWDNTKYPEPTKEQLQ